MLPYTQEEFDEFKKKYNISQLYEIVKNELSYKHKNIFPALAELFHELKSLTNLSQNTLRIAQKNSVFANVVEGYLLDNPSKMQSVIVEINTSEHEVLVDFSMAFFEHITELSLNPFKIQNQLSRECYEIFHKRRKRHHNVADILKIIRSGANIPIYNPKDIVAQCRKNYMEADAQIKKLEKIKNEMAIVVQNLSIR